MKFWFCFKAQEKLKDRKRLTFKRIFWAQDRSDLLQRPNLDIFPCNAQQINHCLLSMIINYLYRLVKIQQLPRIYFSRPPTENDTSSDSQKLTLVHFLINAFFTPSMNSEFQKNQYNTQSIFIWKVNSRAPCQLS